MTIALIILHADPRRGGAERYTVDLARALAGRGHAVALVSSTFDGEFEGVRCVELRSGGITRLGHYRQFLDALDEHLAASAYDVAHAMLPVRRCDVYHPHAGIAAEAVRSGHARHASPVRRMLSAWANRANVKRRAFADVERALLAGAGETAAAPPVVLCLSEYVKAEVRRHYPSLPPDRLQTLFNAVDLKKFDPAARPQARADLRRQWGAAEGDPVGLIVAQDFRRKGLFEAIDALARTGQERHRLVVVGRGERRPYQLRAAGRGVERRVLFAGAQADVYPFYAAADYFVLPTRHDPCSLVVLEALAMGLPVISTRQNGATEIMTDGVHGYVLESADDQEGLAQAMRAMADAEARARMRRACLELRPRLAYEAHVARLLEIYQTVHPAPSSR